MITNADTKGKGDNVIDKLHKSHLLICQGLKEKSLPHLTSIVRGNDLIESSGRDLVSKYLIYQTNKAKTHKSICNIVKRFV